MMTKYPIKLVKQVRTALWGRELWLVSAHPSQPSVVANGLYAGRTLPELSEEFGEELVGTKAMGGFPLLVKIIEAKDRLSLQVHPSETTQRLCGGDPKAEMWYALDGCAPKARLFAGLKDGVDRKALHRSLHDGSVEERVVRFDVKRGDVLYIPGGLIHAIDGGCRLYELQRTSDTTWRLHDWNRVDPATGRARPMHEREGLAAIDWTLPPPALIHDDGGPSERPLVSCAEFTLGTLCASSQVVLPGDAESFRILFAERGSCSVVVMGDEPVALETDECLLIPAGTEATILPSHGVHLLVARL